MKERNDDLLPEPTIERLGGRNDLGGAAVGVAAVRVHHRAERRGGGDGAGVELVAGQPDDYLVEAVEIRAGVRGQSGERRESGRALVEQEGDADDGRDSDRAGAESDDAGVGAMETAGGGGVAVGGWG